MAALYERGDDAVLKADVQKVQEQDSFCKQMKLYLKAGELPAMFSQGSKKDHTACTHVWLCERPDRAHCQEAEVDSQDAVVPA